MANRELSLVIFDQEWRWNESSSDYADLLRREEDHYRRAFEKLKPLLVEDLRIEEEYVTLGSLSVSGSSDALTRLEEQVEEMGLGSVWADKLLAWIGF